MLWSVESTLISSFNENIATQLSRRPPHPVLTKHDSHFRRNVDFGVRFWKRTVSQLFVPQSEVVGGQQIHDKLVAVVVVPDLDLHPPGDQFLLRQLLLKAKRRLDQPGLCVSVSYVNILY